MHQPFGVQTRSDAGTVEYVDRALLEHAGADAPEHVLGAALFEDDGVDARLVQQLPEQQPGRSRADDRDLCTHSPSTSRHATNDAARRPGLTMEESQQYLDFSQARRPRRE